MSKESLIGYCKNCPGLEIQDVFKFLYQSCFGCEHLASDYDSSLKRILDENGQSYSDDLPDIEMLGEDYCRVHLKYLRNGLSPETLCRLFILSSVSPNDGADKLRNELESFILCAGRGEVPFSEGEVKKAAEKWEKDGFPSIHHSPRFNELHHPSYRVIKREYIRFLPLLEKTDKLLQSKEDNIIIAIDGRCASGKTTVAGILSQIYDCNVFHMDDFFLRPAQRSAVRLSSPGENIDHERFLDEVLIPLSEGREVRFQRFDCHKQCLEPIQVVPHRRLNIIEGSYSFHPSLFGYYDLTVFLDITPELQQERIIRRNGPHMAEKFFSVWIPLEEKYFNAFSIRDRADLIIYSQAD